MVVERFFSVSKTPIESEEEIGDSILLLSGPSSSGKTSLLFQYAFNTALKSGRRVVFICSRHKLETNPPFLSQGIDPSSEIFQRIHIKYVEDDESIKNYFSAFHLQDDFPVSVVIDDFADFFDERNCQERYNNPRGRDLAMVRTLALSQNAINHANLLCSRISPCKLLVSDTHNGDSPRLLYIYKRWVSSIYTIKGDQPGSFLLKNDYNRGIPRSGERRTAKYSIALQYLVLEGITEDA